MSNGGFTHLPVPAPARLTSPFGYRTHPIKGTRSFHNGIDLAVAVGTPAFAVGAGKVSAVYTGETGGLQIVLRLDGGGRAGYAHLDRAHVVKGQRVRAGQQIATTGNTGLSTGPHLHFTTRDASGERVDPMSVLPPLDGSAPDGSLLTFALKAGVLYAIYRAAASS